MAQRCVDNITHAHVNQPDNQLVFTTQHGCEIHAGQLLCSGFQLAGGGPGDVLVKQTDTDQDFKWQSFSIPALGFERPYLNKMRDIVSVKDYGAVGDGVVDDTLALQAAADVFANGGGSLVFPFGTYKISSTILFAHGNIHIVGNGSIITSTIPFSETPPTAQNSSMFSFVSPHTVHELVLVETANEGTTIIKLSDTSNVRPGDHVSLMSNQLQYTGSFFHDQNVVTSVGTGVDTGTVTLETPLVYPLVVGPHVVSAQCYKPISNITLDGLTFMSTDTHVAVWVKYVQNMMVTNCKFYNCYMAGIMFDDVRDCRLINSYMEGHITDDPDTTLRFYLGAVATRGRRVQFSNNTGVRLGYMYTGWYVYTFSQTSSIASKIKWGAFGGRQSIFDLTVYGNTADRTGTGVYVGLTATVSGNSFYSNMGIFTPTMTLSDPGRAKYSITNNRMSGNISIFIASCIDMLLINGNYMENQAGGGIRSNSPSLKNMVISNNNIVGGFGIDLGLGPGNMQLVSNVLVHGNTVLNYTFFMINVVGSSDITLPANNLKITDNFGIPNPTSGSATSGVMLKNIGWYGEDIVVRGNSHWGIVRSVVTLPYELFRCRAYPVVELNDTFPRESQGCRDIGYFPNGTSIPANATVLRGSVMVRASPSANNPVEYVVVESGTQGTLTGITGNITSGSSTLTMTGNTATVITSGVGVYPGSFINVAGAGAGAAALTARVLSVSADLASAQLSVTASTSVVAADISRKIPVVKNGANLSI